MNIKEFESLARTQFNACLNLMLKSKNEEYSRKGDKLHNFKVAGRVNRESPEKALWGMFMKHFVSLQDMVNDIEIAYRILDPDAEVKIPTKEKLFEKTCDAINYISLLTALIMERIQDRETPTEKMEGENDL